MPSATLRVPNHLDALSRLDQEAMAFLTTVEASADLRHAVSLAIEEIVSNIITYGYPDSADHEIQVELIWDHGELHLSFLDDGPPFDPLTVEPPDLTLPIAERPIGGLGIYLVRQFFPHARYRRDSGCNRLDLQRPAT